MRFEGDRDFPLPPAEVFAKLRDARFLVGCIPDSSPQGEPTQDKAQCTVRPGFAFVRGTLELTIRVAESVPGQSAKVLVLSKGMGNSSTVEALLTFAPQDSGTRLHWQAQVKELGGLLKLVPQGLVRGAAQKVIADAWTAVEAQLAAT